MSEHDPNTADQAEEEKSGGWGCLKIVLILFAFGILGTIGLVYYVLNTPAGKHFFNAASEGYSLFKDAQAAPGTEALRNSGCKEAAVFDLARLRTLIERFDGDTSADIDTDMPVDAIVTCRVPVIDSAPNCDALALVYISAASPKADFGLVVKHRKTVVVNEENDTVLCDGLYDPQGKHKSSLQEAKKTKTQP